MELPFKVIIGYGGYHTYTRKVRAENIRQAIDNAEKENKEWAAGNHFAGPFDVLSVIQWSK